MLRSNRSGSVTEGGGRKIDRRNKILCADPTEVPLIVAGNGLSDLRNPNSNYSACIIVQTLGPFMGEYESSDMCAPIKSTPIPLEEQSMWGSDWCNSGEISYLFRIAHLGNSCIGNLRNKTRISSYCTDRGSVVLLFTSRTEINIS